MWHYKRAVQVRAARLTFPGRKAPGAPFLTRRNWGLFVEARRRPRWAHEAGAHCKVAEALPLQPFRRIVPEQGADDRNDFRFGDGGLVKDVEPRAVEGCAKVHVVPPGRLAHKADLGEERPAAPVRAAGHADHDGVVPKSGGLDLGVELVQQAGKAALALREGQPARGQRDARHRIKPQAGRAAGVVEIVLLQKRLDPGAVRRGDARYHEVLVWREAEIAAMDPGDLAERRLCRILHAPVLDEESEMRIAVGALRPAVPVARVRELEPAGRAELPSKPALDLRPYPGQPAVGDRVLEPGVPPVGPVAVVALHGDNLLGDVDGLAGEAEPEDIGEARIGIHVVVGHTQPAADRDVEAGQSRWSPYH